MAYTGKIQKNMIRKHLMSWLCLVLLLGALPALAQTRAEPTNTSNESMLLTVQGSVEIAAQGTTTWSPGTTNQLLKAGDRVRTGKNSRATVRLSNLSILRVHELTTLEIQAPEKAGNNPTLDLKSGAVYFFNRDKPETTQFRTPTASGAIRGTEFNLAVAEDGRMLLTLVDGEVDLQNELGTLELRTGEQALVEPGQAPRKTAAVDTINVIQWTLYYPAVLDPEELGLSDDLKVQLAPSLDAYRSGDLLRAVDSYPFDRESGSAEDKVYRAALLLSVGNVDQAQSLLQNLGDGRAAALGKALQQLISAVKNEPFTRANDHELASEWLAASYHAQSSGDLELALEMARAAVGVSPNFGFAHARVAELEFSFGHTDAAMKAINRGLELSPRNAYAHSVHGFLLTAKNKMNSAAESFDQAIAMDGSLGNAWLGRGLVKIKQGNVNEGRKDLETAAALEPNRAIFRSYLGKAWSMGQPFSYSWDQKLADKELDLAKRLDPNDPTSYLYSALLNQQRNQVNQAVEDLETSQNLNDNRRIYRSRMLLDQDKAVRSANLASIYRDAGMIDYSVREASKAVNSDPANYSAHMFLAQAYDSLRDPRAINLRYDTPWLNELLLANLLQPVGAGNLSQTISQQEYSRLFEADRLGLFSLTEYQSNGDWLQQASQFGTIDKSSYALDLEYRSHNGQRINDDMESLYVSAKFKQQLTEKDSVFLQITRQEMDGGDLLQYYDQRAANTTLRFNEVQEPNIYAGYHREWNPGNHTLFLFGRLANDFELTAPFLSNAVSIVGFPANGAPSFAASLTGQQTNRSDTTFYSTELQQMVQLSSHTLIAGGRFQIGETENTVAVRPTGFLSNLLKYNDTIETDFKRFSAYMYDYWQILDPLQITAGLTYDRLDYPVNTDLPPISPEEESKDQISPKLGLRYTPLKDTTVRAAYTRSLGGLFSDSAVRLEPVQVAGFTQAYRSATPESVAGSIAGTEFTTYGLGVEQRFATRTYITLSAEVIDSDSQREFGAFGAVPGNFNLINSNLTERLDYSEQSLTLAVNQLLGDEFSVGGRYRISKAELEDRFAGMVGTFRELDSTLQEANLFAIYNHRCGFFLRNDITWTHQDNSGPGSLTGDDFWQMHAFAGYRFPRRQAEIRVGVLNIFEQDYKLSPVNFYLDYPRERTFVASLKFQF